MKRVVIMGFLTTCSAIIVSSIIIAAGSFSQTLTSWSGSRFWYAIFGSRSNPGFDLSMGLGTIFTIFSILLLAGMSFLVIELLKKQNDA